MVHEIPAWVKRHRGDVWTCACLLLVGWSAYNLGIIRARQGAVPLQDAPLFRASAADVPQASATGQGSPATDRSDPRVVVSRASSSRKYHHAWCPGASQINEANRVWFPTAADAEAAGYSLAGNCTR